MRRKAPRSESDDIPERIDSGVGNDTLSLVGWSQVFAGWAPVFTRLLLVLVGLEKFHVSAGCVGAGFVMALISASLSWSVLLRLLLFLRNSFWALSLPCNVGAPVHMASAATLSLDLQALGRIHGSTPM